jgi:hypothetical protein
MDKILATLIALYYFTGKAIKAYHSAVLYGKLSILNIIKWTFISFLLPFIVWLFHHLFHFNIWPVLNTTQWMLGR